jgi:hypothetical protein
MTLRSPTSDAALAPGPHPPARLQRLDPRVRSLWLLTWLIGTALSLFVTVCIPIGLELVGVDVPRWVVASGVALAVAVSAFDLARSLLRFQTIGYRLGPATVDFADGALWRSETATPYIRIQHVDIAQGPLERAFGLARLVVHTAAASNTIAIPGVPADQVASLREQILAQVGRDDGV